MAQKARRLLPLGGSREGGSHKGYGLAILVEILCGVLTGTVTALNAESRTARSFFRRDSIRSRFGQRRNSSRHGPADSRIEIDAADRRPRAAFMWPGEIEFETAEERAERGIPLHSTVLKGLREVERAVRRAV